MKKFLKRLHSRQKGFTLVELLIVVAIIGVLAAIIVPSVGKYIGSGQTAANKAELALVKNAVAATMADAAVDSLTAGGIPLASLPVTVDKSTNLSLTGPGGTHDVAEYFDGGIAGLKKGYSVTDGGSVTVK